MHRTVGDPPGSGVSSESARPVPGPPGLIEFDTSGPLQVLRRLLDEYGDVVRYQSSFGPCFLLAHPTHVQAVLRSENYRRSSLIKLILGDGLLASDGAYWRSQRHLMQGDFLPRRVAPLVPLMARQVERTSREWQDASLLGKDVDVAGAMTRLTLQIVMAALFSSELTDQESVRLCSAVTQALDDLGRISWTIFGAPTRFTPERNAEFLTARAVIDEVCHEMIARRRRLPADQRPHDLLTLLIESCEDDQTLGDRRLRDEMVTMLIGGHETTALALSWAWKALEEHPEIEARLHEEVDRVRVEDAGNGASLSALVWTRAIFQEALRLYPPVWYMARVAIDDDVIDGYPIPRGACVLVSAWFTHRHPRFWQEPERFAPERFLPEQPYAREAYFPFGSGRHTCLGMHFALLEGTLILALLARSFRLRATNGAEIRPNPGITLRQTPPLRARIELRSRRSVESAGQTPCGVAL